MTIDKLGTGLQQTKDNLGPRDTTKEQVLLLNTENIYIEEGPTDIQTQLIGTAFILGHPSNGILGTSAFGAGTMGSYTTYAVVNPNNVFHEHFRENRFYDSSNSANVDWDTTNFRIEFSNGGEARTLAIFYNSTEIASVKLTIDVSGMRVRTQIDVANFPQGREVNLT